MEHCENAVTMKTEFIHKQDSPVKRITVGGDKNASVQCVILTFLYLFKLHTIKHSLFIVPVDLLPHSKELAGSSPGCGLNFLEFGLSFCIH